MILFENYKFLALKAHKRFKIPLRPKSSFKEQKVLNVFAENIVEVKM